jgi:preprotein translocase subunit SecG
MFNFNWIESIFILVSLIFIFLVVIQANTTGSSGGLNSSNDGLMKVTLLTKITALLGILLLVLVFFMNMKNKNVSNLNNNNITQLEDGASND